MNRRELGLLAACVAVFLALSLRRAGDHAYPYWDDVGFLELGNQVREMGGPLPLFEALFAGTWTEDNRNPLYPALLSLVAGRDPGYHTRAIALNLGLGVLALVAWWWFNRRHFGPRTALIVAAFFALSETTIEHASKETSEPLLLIFWALALERIFRGPRAWWAAGVFAGLAQLTKGSGIFLVAILAVTLLLERGWKAVRDWRAWTMPAGFVVAALPLLWRNAVVFGTPLHHWNNRLLWNNRMPDYAETYAPHALERIPHGFSQWIRHTTFLDVVWGRLLMGIAEVSVHIGDAISLMTPRNLGPWHIPGVIVGFALFVVALRLLWKEPPSFKRTFLLVQAAFFVVFFVWFSVLGGASRYMIPMTLPLLAVLATHADARWLKRYAFFAAACVAIALVFDPYPRRLPDGFGEAQDWLAAHVRPGEAYVVDSRSHLEPLWRMPRETRMEIVSSAWQRQPIPAGELLEEFRRRGVRYVVIDGSSHKDAQLRYFFFDTIHRNPDGGIEPQGLPAGLRPVYVGAEQPRTWLVLELVNG